MIITTDHLPFITVLCDRVRNLFILYIQVRKNSDVTIKLIDLFMTIYII